MKRTRSGVVILEQGRVALIKRTRAGQVYYVVPGGGVESGETVEEAAVREAHEELGVVVSLNRLLAVVEFNGNEQYYHLATITGGVFGTGTGPEFFSASESVRGSYTPVWMNLGEVARHDVRPKALARLLADGGVLHATEPLRIAESF